MGSINPNSLATILPGAGTSFAVQTSDIANQAVDSTCIKNGAVGATQLANNAVGSTQLANNSVGSAQLALNALQVADVTLTPAQIKTLYSAPTQIIAAPGSGKSIVVEGALARFTQSGAQYTSGGAVQLQYDNTVHAGGTTPLTTLAAAVVTAASSADTQLQQAAASTTVTQNKGIFASCATADFATGTAGSLQFIVWYRVV